MGSMAWSKEEAQYFRSLLAWESGGVGAAAAAGAGKPSAARDRRPVKGEFRFLVLGDKSCGKTSLLTRVDGEPYAVDALELSAEHLLADDGHLLRQALVITQAAVLVYDVRSRDSLAAVRRARDLICGAGDAAGNNIDGEGGSSRSRSRSRSMSRRPRDYGLILVGTKCDDEQDDDGSSSSSSSTTARVVTWAEGSQLAESFGAVSASASASAPPFLEVSAATGDGVDEVFPRLGREVLELRRLAGERRAAARADAAAADAEEAEEEDYDNDDDDDKMGSSPAAAATERDRDGDRDKQRRPTAGWKAWFRRAPSAGSCGKKASVA
ncbi:hypothetical protein GGR56DRAFT_697633 [Xylariaceae sp. FL0804]|nr:hypothetical protein GGR56DRAFT_697633 [Xylariaceae sp. FL0804]